MRINEVVGGVPPEQGGSQPAQPMPGQTQPQGLGQKTPGNGQADPAAMQKAKQDKRNKFKHKLNQLNSS